MLVWMKCCFAVQNEFRFRQLYQSWRQSENIGGNSFKGFLSGQCGITLTHQAMIDFKPKLRGAAWSALTVKTQAYTKHLL